MSLAITSVGLTLGGWFYTDLAQTYGPMMGKGKSAGNLLSYHLISTNAVPYFRVSTNGSTLVDVASTVSYDHAVWFFCAGRWNPSTETAVWCNGTKTVNTTGIPATLYNTSEQFRIGELNGLYLDGKASMCWLCNSVLEDDVITAIYESQRSLFGLDMEG